MAFGDDVRGELFNKLGVDQQNDPLKMLEQGDKEIEVGNHSKGKALYQKAYEIAGAHVDRYLAQSQHRSAAQSLYTQVLAQERLGNEQEKIKLYAKVVDELLEAAKTALAFGEDNRGIATVTLAGLVCVMANNQDRAFSIYSEYINVIGDKPNSEFLKKLLYSLGYTLDALKNDNIAALTDAQNYISTDLIPLLATSKLTAFEILLNSVVQHTQDVLQSRITMPKIDFSSTVPRDLQFNEIFEMGYRVVNNGDGIASTLKVDLEIPEDIEVLDGETEVALETFDPAQELTKSLSLRLQTGDSTGEFEREISGNLIYTDMLGNSHKQFIGPLQLVFTAMSKKEEFTQTLNGHISSAMEIEQLYGDIPNLIYEQYLELVNTTKAEIEQLIEMEEFEKVETGLSILENEVNWIRNYTSETQKAQALEGVINEKVTQAENSLREALEKRYEQDKADALTELRTKLTEEKQTELKAQRESIESTFREEIIQLREDHDNQMRQLQTSHDNKVKQQLVHLENSLKEEFRQEMAQKSEETEQAIRELQENERVAVEEAKQSTREEVTARYEEKLREMEESMEELRRQLTTRAEEEKQLELRSLEQRLEKETQQRLEAQERDLMVRIKQEFEEELEQKDREIGRLKEELASSNDGTDH